MSQIQVTGEAKIRDLQGPVVANSGIITALDGLPSQYVRGDGTLADIPSVTGGGASVSYYLNGSVNQGTFGGSTYYQLGENAITGVGTNFSTSTDGLLAQFITDAGVPDVTEIPSGNWNIEFYMGVSASSGALASFYVDIFKYDGTTFTLIGSNSTTPDFLTNTTTVDAYFTSVAMPLTAMAQTDRIAIRVYANVAGKTVTIYTEDNRLCQVVTTFSRGMLSLNSLTDQQQYLTVGTAGTDFNIVSAIDTHTFNIPVASATKTGKLSSTDWSTFNNKQNTIIDPITGTGTSTGVAYFNSGTSITSEAAFNYDASTNRLGVNTSVPNATIGANAATDSGYSLLLKNDNANYNGIGFGTDSTYGNLMSTEKLGTAPSRNLTLLNQSGFVSLTEAGNLGVNILNPNTGVDIYNGTSAYLWLHTANSGITGTDGVRLALFSTNGANLRNFDGSFSITAEGDFSVITLGAENFKINSADGSIYQSKVANAMLKSVSGVITAAVANSDYQLPITLTTSGSSGAATFSSNTLNIPNYTLSGLGGVPTSRTLTINGTSYDLSADRSWSVGTMGGSGSAGRVAYYDGVNSITSESGFIYDSSTNRLGVNTTVPNATIGANAGTDSGYSLLLKNADNNYNGIGFGTDSTYGNLISTEKLGTAPARNLTLLNQSGFASLKENGSFGINTLNPAVAGVGIDIYSSTSAGLRFHTATSGTTVSDGAGINFSSANNLGITNYEAGAIDIVTNGNSGVYIASNGFVGINGATPSVALTVNGNATVSGLTSGNVVFPTTGGLLTGTSNFFWDASNIRLGIGLNNPQRRVEIYSATADSHLRLSGSAPSVSMGESITGSVYQAKFALATGTGQFVSGSVAGDFVILNQTGNIIYGTNNTEKARLTTTGSFGLGTTSPDTLLDVRGEISLSYNATNGLRFYNQDRSNWSSIGNNIATGSSSANLVFRTSSGVALTIDSNRNTTFATAATFSSSVSATSATLSDTVAITLTSSDSRILGGNSTGRLLLANSGTSTYGIFYGASHATAPNAISLVTDNTERIRVTNTGNVGIGTSSPNLSAGATGSTIVTISASASGRNGILELNGTRTTENDIVGYVRFFNNAAATPLADIRAIRGSSDTAGSLTFDTSGTERMRITSAGSLLVGTSSEGQPNISAFQYLGGGQTGAYSGVVRLLHNSNNVSGSGFVDFWYNGSNIGSISQNGTTNVAYNTSSDYRLKEDLKDYSGIDLVSAIKTYDYQWKSDKSRMYGVMAHELAEVIPYAVTGEKDGERMQGVDYSKIVPVLVKAIQEQNEIITKQGQSIEELKALIAAK